MVAGVPGGRLGPVRQVPALARTAVAAGGVGVVEHPLRAPGPEDVELTISLCGLCGADIVVYRADPAFDWVSPGTVLGQEAVGVVSATGLLVPDWPSPGTRVVPLAVAGCGRCEPCTAGHPEECPRRSSLGLSRHGAAAGRMVVPWRNLLQVPESLPDTTAVLAEPTSIAWRAASIIGRTGPGDRVAVSTTRAVGLLAALIAQSRGADVVMVGRDDPRYESRRRLAERLGLRTTTALEPDSIDTWIEASGSGKLLTTAVDALRPDGRLVLVALYATGAQQPVSTMPGKRLTVLTSYSSTRADYEAALDFLTTMPRLGDELVSVYPMTRAVEALRDAAEGTAADGSALFKAVLQPSG
jgi:threonine dehydrogenase-like Zn-dependent dehydrogenase